MGLSPRGLAHYWPIMQPRYQTIIDHYEKCLAEHGDCCRGVDWPNAADAETRYRVMLDAIREPAGTPLTLLDFGCGAAHLYAHLQRRRWTHIRYLGVDASPRFIEVSRRKFPEIEFLCADVLAEAVALPEVDYVVLNGVFTEKRELPFEQMRDYMFQLLERVYSCARRGLAFNVMSHHVDWQRADLFHMPYDVLASFLTARLSRHFVFRADYGLYEYTTYVYREHT